MPTHKPTELSRIKLKTWTQQPVPMVSEHSAHLIHVYLLLISMHWHRQAIFESKGEKLSSPAERRIWTQGIRRQIARRLNARWQNDRAIEGQAKKIEPNSPSLWSASIQPTRPHCRLAFAPGSGDIHVFANFDALTQTSDFRIERRQVVFICWMPGSNPGSLEPNLKHTEFSRTNRQSYWGWS